MDQNHPIIHVHDLEKEYLMGELTVHALENIQLDLFAGEFVVLLGASGSGKSTLLNILGGLDSATNGVLLYKNQDLSNCSDSELTRYRKDHVGFVFQFYNLIANLTALENIELVTDIAENPMPATRALDLVGLSERYNHYPSQMSGGEQQRVAIARAIAKQPDILLCDEPTGALDLKTGKIVLEAIQKVNQEFGTLVVVITHNAGIANIADRVIFLADGQITRIQLNPIKKKIAEVVW